MKLILLTSVLLWSQAEAVKLVFNVVPKIEGTKLFLLPTGDAVDSCNTSEISNCQVAPGTYELSVYPPGDYGAIVDRPITITQAAKLTINLPAPTAAGPGAWEDWSNFTYKVKSTCPTDVTYREDGNTRQESSADDGWTSQTPKGTFAYLSAQLTCTAGYVTAYIILGGKVVKQASSHGDYVIAQVSYP